MVSRGQSISGELRLVAHSRQSYDVHLKLTGAVDHQSPTAESPQYHAPQRHAPRLSVHQFVFKPWVVVEVGGTIWRCCARASVSDAMPVSMHRTAASRGAPAPDGEQIYVRLRANML